MASISVCCGGKQKHVATRCLLYQNTFLHSMCLLTLKTEIHRFSWKERACNEGHSATELEAQLLLRAEEGDRSRVQILLRLMMDQSHRFDLNCRCKCRFTQTKRHAFAWLTYFWIGVLVFLTSAIASARSEASAGWTSLHLSSHFGHKDVVEDLLKVRQLPFRLWASKGRVS